MKLLSAYVSCIKKNPRAHLIFTLAASAAVTARIMQLMLTFMQVGIFEGIFYALCPFLSLSAFWLCCVSPVRSPLWLYRVVGIYLFVSIGYDSSVNFICGETVIGPHRHLRWLVIWLIPLGICLGALLLHRLFSFLAAKKSKAFTVFRVYRLVLMMIQPFMRCEKKDAKLNTGRKFALSVGCILMCLSALMLTMTTFLHFHFPSMDIEAILFTIRFANDGYTPEMGRKLVVYACAAVTAAVVLCIRLVRMTRSDRIEFRCPDKKGKFTAGSKGARLTLWIVLPVVSVTALFFETSTFSYISKLMRTSTIYEEHYVAPSTENVVFPEKKKNLIYLYLESFENSYTTPENGGLQDSDIMPELTKLAKQNLNFSHSDKLGGSIVRAPSIAYTMGATIAQTSGVLLMTPLGKMRNDMGELKSFLPSLRRLEDVLHDNGYEQLYIEGSDASFAAYNSYVGRYDDSNVFDLYKARDEGLIPKNYFEMWGFEDRKMFEFSKQKIDELAKGDKPFAVTMYTMDTHSFEEGYRCQLCDNSLGNRFASAVNCTSRQVDEFINWLKTKPYFEDTVVIITGDHIAEHVPKGIELEKEGYERTPYNCFINAQKTPESAKNRVFSPLDMFPTTLSAMGAEIKGGRLGLGTDLFSDKKTLAEEMGRENFTEQIQLSSDYFNREFWKEQR